MTYTPHPIDTSRITLSDSLLQLTESLAEHAHDVWARQRIGQGWNYGGQRNDELKQHPCLVPYDELSDSEKQYDRNAALETLKLISALGYQLVAPPAAEKVGDPLLAQLRAAAWQAASGRDKAKSELGALLDIWSKRRDDDPAWCGSPEPFCYLANRFLGLGAAPLAKEVARTALEYRRRFADGQRPPSWEDDTHLCLAFGLALARTANVDQAQQVLGELHDRLKMDEDRTLEEAEKHVWQETLGMLGRTFKDRSEQATDPAVRQEWWSRSLKLYKRAYRLTGGYWTGINVATLARLDGDEALARQVAHEVRDQCLAKLSQVPAGDDNQYWIPATLGEAALVLGDFLEAEQYYRQAYQAVHQEFGKLNTTRRHARWLLNHWQQDLTQLDAWLPIPQVVVFAGHMIDQPGRSRERFPARLAGAVKATIKNWLREHHALVGFSSAACGADILFQEALRELGGECRVVLPYDESEFLVDSVDLIPGADWTERFAAVMQNAVQVVRASSARLECGSVAYEFANQVLQGLAVRRAAELETPLVGLTVWNGEPGDAPGGTATVATHWRDCNVSVFRVDLSQLPVEIDSPLPVIGHDWNIPSDAIPVRPSLPVMEAEEDLMRTTEHRNSRVSALLFADAVGFSKLPDAEIPLFVREFLTRIARLLDEFERYDAVIPSKQGTSIAPSLGNPDLAGTLNRRCPVRETWGDGIFLAFNSLPDAGEFALRLMELIRDTDWKGLGFSQPLSLRAALHAGPVYPDLDPITGLPKAIGSHVSRAARLEPKTPPGEIYASDAFAALLALNGAETFVCDYVKQLEWAKHYGTFPTYVVRRRSS